MHPVGKLPMPTPCHDSDGEVVSVRRDDYSDDLRRDEAVARVERIVEFGPRSCRPLQFDSLDNEWMLEFWVAAEGENCGGGPTVSR